jgi:hypothetical protein
MTRSSEIDQLRGEIARLTEALQDTHERAAREIVYLRRRVEPITFLIDRGNYLEMLQLLHPLDQKRVREMVMRDA